MSGSYRYNGIQYDIVSTGTFLEMTAEINKRLDDGWVLQGGVCVCRHHGEKYDNDDFTVHQAITKDYTKSLSGE